MALERVDNIGDTTTTTGTGTISLAAVAQTGARIFAGNVTSGATVRYEIRSADNTEWEIGEGVFTDGSPDTLTRVTVYASSNSGSLVNFSAGTKNVSMNLTAIDVATLYQMKEGQVLNGKIVPTVTSNNITLALKGKDGNDPSPTNIVYAMIGGEIRRIVAALSVTVNAGANTLDLGSAEMATKECDLFALLGYNATDGVVIGFSRKSKYRQYSQWSTTATSDSYLAVSTRANAAANDPYVVIGRFAATLSAGAGYTWSVPTYTPLNLVQEPIYKSRLLPFTPIWGGYSANPSGACNFQVVEDEMVIFADVGGGVGTSNATSNTLNAPMTPALGCDRASFPGLCWDNSTAVNATVPRLGWSTSGKTLTAYKDAAGNVWTSSGSKTLAVFGLRIPI